MTGVPQGRVEVDAAVAALRAAFNEGTVFDAPKVAIQHYILLLARSQGHTFFSTREYENYQEALRLIWLARLGEESASSALKVSAESLAVAKSARTWGRWAVGLALLAAVLVALQLWVQATGFQWKPS